MPKTYRTRHTLLDRIKNPNDADAWQEFMEFYKSYIYVIIRSMNIKADDADDILQQISLKLWKNLPQHQHDPEKGKFRAWVSTVSKNTVISFIKKQQVLTQKLDILQQKEEMDYLQSIKAPEIEQIAQKEWEVFITNTALRKLEEYFTAKAIEAFKLHLQAIEAAEIANTLAVSRDSVYKYISRVKLRFIEEIQRLKEDLDI
ncbi:RNA polymerase sigma factor [Lentisphaera marina]|uniref:RNA polymerase sigma factor n=1 Tax=Lentisphaera marina TaxID=1111041 RepID=UPI0023653C14|nr:RNA polymerase sigma factor [Lentisphaera marina]MDD7983713.1 RNA polymerase sigma factor [Lentisphaera marina]